jgi:hypothetical protein
MNATCDYNDSAFVVREKYRTIIRAQVDYIDDTERTIIAQLVDHIRAKGLTVYFIAQSDWKTYSTHSVREWALYVQNAAGAHLGQFDVFEWSRMEQKRFGTVGLTRYVKAIMPSTKELHDAMDWQGMSHFRPRADI